MKTEPKHFDRLSSSYLLLLTYKNKSTFHLNIHSYNANSDRLFSYLITLNGTFYAVCPTEIWAEDFELASDLYSLYWVFFYQENHEWRGSSHPNSARSMSFHSILIRKRQFLLKFQLLGNKLLLDQFIDNQKQIKKNNLIS